jgi:hypothetical protein
MIPLLRLLYLIFEILFNFVAFFFKKIVQFHCIFKNTMKLYLFLFFDEIFYKEREIWILC